VGCSVEEQEEVELDLVVLLEEHGEAMEGRSAESRGRRK
jgi:hypothetical protein